MEEKQRKEKLVRKYQPDSTEAKYCRCVLHVSEKQPEWCLRYSLWRQSRDGKSCYNPYAVCTKSVNRKGLIECFINYNLDLATPSEINVIIYLKSKLLQKHNLKEDLEGLKKLQLILSEKI